MPVLKCFNGVSEKALDLGERDDLVKPRVDFASCFIPRTAPLR